MRRLCCYRQPPLNAEACQRRSLQQNSSHRNQNVSLEIMEALGRKNKPAFTVLTDLVAVLTVLTTLFFQIWGSISRGSKKSKNCDFSRSDGVCGVVNSFIVFCVKNYIENINFQLPRPSG